MQQVVLFEAFKQAGRSIATAHGTFGARQAEAGFTKPDYELLCQHTYWSIDQRRRIPSILANAVSISLSIAGLPPVPLPGHYVAAVIVNLVHPCNLLLACASAPESFDAMAASGLIEPTDVRSTTHEQLQGLMMAYLGDALLEPPGDELPVELDELVNEQTAGVPVPKVKL